MNKSNFSILILVIFLSQIIHGQRIAISGNVKFSTDNSNVVGANIRVMGLNIGTVTDLNGNFKLDVPVDSTILISFIGYIPQQIKIIKTQRNYNILLYEDTKTLNEVVAIGYATQNKKEVTGAVAQLTSEALNRASSVDIGSAIQGQIAGVNVQATSGRPGDGSNIQIRGINTILGQNAPLFVVDGIPYDFDPMIPTSEIATIDVLKDAASSAVYGTRGAGGVILITTKTGSAGVMKVKLDSYYGTQRINSDLPRMTFEEMLYEMFIVGQNVNNSKMNGTYTPLELDKTYFLNRTDLTSVIQNEHAPIHNHSVSVSGGRDGLSYNVMANYFNQAGMILNSGVERFNARVNTTYRVGKWSINTSLGFKQEVQDYEAWGLLLEAYRYKPYMHYISPETQSVYSSDIETLGIVAAKIKQTDERKGDQFSGNIQLSYLLNKNLSLQVRAGTYVTNNLRKRVDPVFKIYDYQGNLIPQNPRSSVYNLSSRGTGLTLESALNYNKRIGFHQFKGLLLYSMEQYTFTSFWARKYDLLSNDVTVLNGATLDPSVGSGTNWEQDKVNALIGMLGRVQYDYKGRYLVSLSARRDGSSRFSEKYRWNIFPSVSVGWNIADEQFWQNLSTVVNGFKLRASYGTTGNQNFLDYSNSAAIALNKDYAMGPESGDKLLLGATQLTFANSNVKWETTIQTNIGFDLAFLSNKLTFTADLYDSNKKDMLFPILLPPTTGAGQNATVVLNVGDMTNRGVELTLNYRKRGIVSYNIGTTFSKNVNLVTKMSGSNKTIYMSAGTVVDGISNVDRVTVVKEGYEAGALFLMPTNGIVRSSPQLAEYQKLVPTAKLGDLMYIDTTGDGILDDNDRVYAGSGAPLFTMGLNSTIEYKNFDLSMQWYWSYGNKVINGNKIYAYMHSTHKDLVYQWSPQNVDSPIPANRGRDHGNYRGYSDFWIQDGSYVRLKNISLGYSIPTNFCSKLGITKLKVYLSSINPLTITKYDGFDPEVGNDGLSTRGLDKGSYPISSQYKAGILLEF
jgi:TonB-linked SusC/RagA family outer membrane protein